MDLWTIDFETYWGEDYTLSKMTTESYVRDPRFETVLCSFKRNDKPAYWVDGCDVAAELERIDISQHAVLAHHAHFDGLILSHHYNARPRRWYDTLSMARALYGSKGGLGLGKLLELHGMEAKGVVVNEARGKTRAMMSDRFMEAYGGYCCHDSSSTYELFKIFLPYFNATEQLLIDRSIRFFTEPVLVANCSLLEQYLLEMRAEKNYLLLQAGVTLKEVMSADKFAEGLRNLGIEPPLKMSPTSGKANKKFGKLDKHGELAIDKKTGKPFPQVNPKRVVYAFAKTDEAMQALEEHEDDAVQVLVAARLKNKSTINETRALRIIGMAGRGKLCLYVKYYGADQTGRDAGGDKMNWLNLQRKGVLRRALLAPKGCVIVVGDSANIESRMLDWSAGQTNAVKAYRLYDKGLGPDIYCVTGEMIYGHPIDAERDFDKRQMGKVTKLGLGFGMGYKKFVYAVRAQAKDKHGKPMIITEDFSWDVVQAYRNNHDKVGELWDRGTEALWMILKRQHDQPLDPRGIVTTCKSGLRLPNGMKIRYHGLQYEREDESNPDSRKQFTYWNGRTREKIYGAKVIENVTQALARIVVMEQLLTVSSRWKSVLRVYDEGVWCVPERHAEELKAEVEIALTTPLDWCKTLPLNCDVKHHRSYGRAKA